MWITLDDDAIFVSTRLGLIAVDYKVARISVRRQKAPFGTSWKTSATATLQDCIFDLLDNRFGLHLQGFLQTFVSTRLFVLGELVRIRIVPTRRRDLGNRLCFRHYKPVLDGRLLSAAASSTLTTPNVRSAGIS